MNAIVADGLVKIYRSRKSEVRALDGLDLTVEEGTVLGLATLAIASLVNFYVGYLVLEGALPAKIQLLGQAVDLASSAAGDLRQASDAVARTEQGLTETADQMRTQVSDASEKIHALETRIAELQRQQTQITASIGSSIAAAERSSRSRCSPSAKGLPA